MDWAEKRTDHGWRGERESPVCTSEARKMGKPRRHSSWPGYGCAPGQELASKSRTTAQRDTVTRDGNSAPVSRNAGPSFARRSSACHRSFGLSGWNSWTFGAARRDQEAGSSDFSLCCPGRLSAVLTSAAGRHAGDDGMCGGGAAAKSETSKQRCLPVGRITDAVDLGRHGDGGAAGKERLVLHHVNVVP